MENSGNLGFAKNRSHIPDGEVFGETEGEVLVVGWGGTFGAINAAVEELRGRNLPVSSIHLKYLNPFPKNLPQVLSRFEKILVPELNLGQLSWLLRAKYLV